MSLTHGHFYMAEKLYSQLSQRLKQILDANYDEYYVGALGPDALYWSDFFTVIGAKLGDQHVGDTGKFIFHLISAAARRIERGVGGGEACMAFALGWVTHWMTDLYVHSLVDKYGGNYLTGTSRHVQLELVETKYIHEKIKNRDDPRGSFTLSQRELIRDFIIEAFQAAYVVHGGGYEPGKNLDEVRGILTSDFGLVAMGTAYKAAEVGCQNTGKDAVIPAEYTQLLGRMLRIYAAYKLKNIFLFAIQDGEYVATTAPLAAWASERAFIPSDETYKSLLDPIDLTVTTYSDRIDVKATIRDTGLYGRFLADYEAFITGAVSHAQSVASIVDEFLGHLDAPNRPSPAPGAPSDWEKLGYSLRLRHKVYDRDKARAGDEPFDAGSGAGDLATKKRGANEVIFNKYGVDILVPEEWGVHDLLVRTYGTAIFSAASGWDIDVFSTERGISALMGDRYGFNTLIPERHWPMLAAANPGEIQEVLKNDPHSYVPGIGRDPLYCTYEVEFADGPRPPGTVAQPLHIVGSNALYDSQRAEATFSIGVENQKNRPYAYRLKVALTLKEEFSGAKYENIESKRVEGIHADIRMITTATAIEVGYRGPLAVEKDGKPVPASPLPLALFPNAMVPVNRIVIDTQDAHHDARASTLSWQGNQFTATFRERTDNRPLPMPGNPAKPVCGARTRTLKITGTADFDRNVVSFEGFEEVTDVCRDEEMGFNRSSRQSFSATCAPIIDLDEDGMFIRLGLDISDAKMRSAARYHNEYIDKGPDEAEISRMEQHIPDDGKAISGSLYIEFRI